MNVTLARAICRDLYSISRAARSLGGDVRERGALFLRILC